MTLTSYNNFDKVHVLYNAKIHTQDVKQPLVNALAFRNGRIVALGTDEQVLTAFPSRASAQDMDGLVILPGLTDAHIHLEYYGRGLQKVDCETPTKAECLRRVTDRLRSTPPGKWVLGHGWNQNVWEGGAFPCAADLDAISRTHPILLTAKSLHAAWANSLALQMAGINAKNAQHNPMIPLDAQGNLSGILLEDASELILSRIPAPSPDELNAALLDAQTSLWKMGITGVHNFDGGRCFSALQAIHCAGKLRLRVLQDVPLDLLDHAVGLGLRGGFGDDFLRIGSVKAFMDGALGPQTAAMLEPFEQATNNKGMLLMDGEQLFEHGKKAAQCGLSMAVHAIGDRATHEALNAFEQLRSYERTQGLPALRHRIEHLQLLHTQDVDRPARLGVIASMQPVHATSDMEIAERYWGQRAALSYAWQSQRQAGALLVFGSDAPVESPNPFWGLHAAVTRRRMDGSPGKEGWYAEQRLSLTYALHAYTTAAAFAAGMEDRLGMLSPGFYADLIVLEQDPFEMDAQDLHSLQVRGTLVNGEWVLPVV